MITLAEWKIIGAMIIVTFYLSAIAIAIIGKIATRIKNKTKRKVKQQINHNVFKIDYSEFIKTNYEQQYIGQAKVYRNELVRMIG